MLWQGHYTFLIILVLFIRGDNNDTLLGALIIQVNLLITTDVAEEGLHLPTCSFVIRFDLPKTVRSYIQSHGRARQSDSRYFIMIERYLLCIFC